MTPAERIAALDAALARSGQQVQIKRPLNATSTGDFSASAECRASVRSVGSGVSHVIISPSDLIAAEWPGPDAAQNGDPLVPVRNKDVIYIAGTKRSISNVHPFYIDDQLVKIEIEATA